LALTSLGCESQRLSSGPLPPAKCQTLSSYTPVEICIVGLSELTPDIDNPDNSKLKIYIDLLDTAGVRIKSPGTFRFELYEYIPRTSQPKGKRIFIWDDIDLREISANNKLWRDHLRAYQFDLTIDFKPRASDIFILETTYISATGKFLSNTYLLKYQG